MPIWCKSSNYSFFSFPQVIVVEAPKQRAPQKPRDLNSRPPADELMTKLKTVIGASLKSQLEKLKLEDKTDTSSSGKSKCQN